LARTGVPGGKMYKTNVWHYNHMLDPQKMNAQSIMPKYPWLIKDELDISSTPAKIRAMTTLGVPYDEEPYPANYDQVANDDLKKQAEEIAADLKANGIDVTSDREIIALIAYLQRLGRDISVKE
jgi:cytochrome c oxidase cbb3-type subunit I/II